MEKERYVWMILERYGPRLDQIHWVDGCFLNATDAANSYHAHKKMKPKMNLVIQSFPIISDSCYN